MVYALFSLKKSQATAPHLSTRQDAADMKSKTKVPGLKLVLTHTHTLTHTQNQVFIPSVLLTRNFCRCKLFSVLSQSDTFRDSAKLFPSMVEQLWKSIHFNEIISFYKMCFQFFLPCSLIQCFGLIICKSLAYSLKNHSSGKNSLNCAYF